MRSPVVDVVVIGAGAMGSAAAWWLARAGLDVVVCEQFEPGHDRGSSHGSSRIFRFAYPDSDYVELARAALPLWRELEDDAGEPLLDITGGVDHGDTPTLQAIAAALGRAGVAHDMLEPEAATERWPGMRFTGPVLYQPDAGRARADATVRALQRRAAYHGAHMRFATPATITSMGDGGVTVRTHTDEELQARTAVVSCGPWAAEALEPWVPALPPLTVTREQTFHFPSARAALAEDAAHNAPWPSFIHYGRTPIYGLEAPGEGVKVAEHHSGARTTADERSFEIDEVGRERVCRYVETWLPGLDPAPSSATTCLYTTTPTQDFVVDRIGPLVIAAGFSGHGFKFTPLIGRLIADLVAGRPLTGPARRFGLDR